ncbi:MAG: hypothetical protein CMJ75_22760 [Planctomycetaceae bacterium]|nr:hypothetical protein [Planctomycetaceae bacterium]
MWSLAATTLLFLASDDLQVTLLSGNEVSGQLVALENGIISLKGRDSVQEYSFSELLTITRLAGRKRSAKPNVWIELTDGCKLTAKGFSVKKRIAEVTLLHGERRKISTRLIRAVRFQPPSATDAQWTRIAHRKVTADVIAIRVDDNVLDELDGILHDIDVDTVHFELDEETVPVERLRLEGVVYFHPPGASDAKPVAQLLDVYGNLWNAQSLVLRSGDLHITTSGALNYKLPLVDLAKIDFSSENLTYLSDLDPDSVTWTPFVGKPDPLAKALFGPRRDRSFSGGLLQLSKPGGRELEYRKGLAIQSRTQLVYRLTEQFQRFKATVGLDHRTRGRGNVDLVILGNRRELLRKTVTGLMEPFDFDLDISGIQRLTILVDYGKGKGIQDHLNLCNARITK